MTESEISTELLAAVKAGPLPLARWAGNNTTRIRYVVRQVTEDDVLQEIADEAMRKARKVTIESGNLGRSGQFEASTIVAAARAAIRERVDASRTANSSPSRRHDLLLAERRLVQSFEKLIEQCEQGLASSTKLEPLTGHGSIMDRFDVARHLYQAIIGRAKELKMPGPTSDGVDVAGLLKIGPRYFHPQDMAALERGINAMLSDLNEFEELYRSEKHSSAPFQVGQIVTNSAPFTSPIGGFYLQGSKFVVELVGDVNTRARALGAGSGVVWIENYSRLFMGTPEHGHTYSEALTASNSAGPQSVASPKSVSVVATILSHALRAYDPNITVSQPTRCAVGSRLLIGERSSKGFKPLGHIDLVADSESSTYVATDENGKPELRTHFTSRASVLEFVVRKAL